MQIRSRKGGRRCACEMCPITTPGTLGMQMSHSQTRTECGTYRISLNIFEYYSNIYHTLAILRFPWPKDETCSCLADCSQLVVWGKFAFSFEFIRNYMFFHFFPMIWESNNFTSLYHFVSKDGKSLACKFYILFTWKIAKSNITAR